MDTAAVRFHLPLGLEQLQDGLVFGHEAGIYNERREGGSTRLLHLQLRLHCEVLHLRLLHDESAGLNLHARRFLLGLLLLRKGSGAMYPSGAHLPRDLRTVLRLEHFIICDLLSDHGGWRG